MIKVNVSTKKITISGHSGYDEIGRDIVCASVSAIATTSINALLHFDKDSINYKVSDGYLEINILKNSKETKILISNMIDLLKEMQTQYKQNIKIYEEVR